MKARFFPVEIALRKKPGLPHFVTINTVVFNTSVLCLWFLPGFLCFCSCETSLPGTDPGCALQEGQLAALLGMLASGLREAAVILELSGI